MEMPEIIKGTSTRGDIEVPLEDVEKFTIGHERYKNGLQIHAIIKRDLVTFFSSYHPERDEYGMVKRKYSVSSVHVRIKDNPKLRKELYALLMQQPTQKKTVGINAGTPAAQSWTLCWKEVPVEVLQ